MTVDMEQTNIKRPERCKEKIEMAGENGTGQEEE